MLHQLIAQSMSSDKDKFDFVIPAKHLLFDEHARLSAGTQAMLELSAQNPLAALEPRALTEHALRQVCSKLGPTVYGKGSAKGLPFDYLTAIPQDLQATNLNRHLVNGNGSRWLVRTHGPNVRAVLDAQYPGGVNESGDFENTQYLKIVQSFIDQEPEQYGDLKLVRPYVSTDELGVKISWREVFPLRDQDGGSYGIGTYIGNSETGTGKLKISPFIQRTACSNSIIYDRENGLEFVHRGSFAAMRTQFKAAIGKVLHAAADVLDAFIEAEYEQLPDFDAILSGLALRHGWAEPVKLTVALGSEGRQTRAGLVNGVTFAAHSAYVPEPNQQIEMETLGGELLFAPVRTFETLAKQARMRAAGLN